MRSGVWVLRVLHLGKRAGVSGPFEHALMVGANRLIPPPAEAVEVNIPLGMRMSIPPGFPRARSYAAGLYEREVTELIQEIIQEGMTIVDLGAFCGYYSLLASRLTGSSGRVYAFEPHPANYAYLVKNAMANGCHNIIAVNKAVFSSTGTKAFAVHKEADHHWLSTVSVDGASGTVPTVSLDDFFSEQAMAACRHHEAGH